MSTKNWIGIGNQGQPGSLKIVQASTGDILDADDDTFKAVPTTPFYTPTENPANPGEYSWTLVGANWGSATYRWYWYSEPLGAGNLVVSAMTLVNDEQPVAVSGLTAQETRDALLLAPLGAAAVGSIDDLITNNSGGGNTSDPVENFFTSKTITMPSSPNPGSTFGTIISGTIADIQAEDGVSFVTAPETYIDDGNPNIQQFGLAFHLSQTIPADVRLNQVLVVAQFTSTILGEHVHVLAWNWRTGSYNEISTPGTIISNSSRMNYFTYPLRPNHMDTTTRVVRIRFRTESNDVNDRLYIDKAVVTTIGETVPSVSDVRWELAIESSQGSLEAAVLAMTQEPDIAEVNVSTDPPGAAPPVSKVNIEVS